MSRVEDDRNEQRIAQQKMLQRQQDEAKARDRKTSESAFAQKLVQSAGEQKVGAQRADNKQGTPAMYESLLDNMAKTDQTQETKHQGQESLGRSVLKQATSAFQEKLQQGRAGENERMGESRLLSTESQAQTAAGRAEDARESDHTSESRTSESKTNRDEQSAKNKGVGGAFAGREEKLKTGADGGGGKGAGGDSGQGGSEFGAGFRFNPALMAPVPVAKARDTSASERLRRVAQEIAQKIVENVRVGTNAAGQSEFQIDLRSNVMKGLSIKVSGGNGKISATFSGSDKEVMKLLEENKEALEKALSGRGLQLAELKIEAKV